MVLIGQAPRPVAHPRCETEGLESVEHANGVRSTEIRAFDD